VWGAGYVSLNSRLESNKEEEEGVDPMMVCISSRTISACFGCVSLNLRLKDLLGPVTRVKKNKKHLVEDHQCLFWVCDLGFGV